VADAVPGPVSVEHLAGRTSSRAWIGGRTNKRHSRGWIVRRFLAAADVVGLSAAFAVTEAIFAGGGGVIGSIGVASEIVIFALCLPLWIVGAQLYGLYDHDDERAYHSTIDEFVSVFHLVTVSLFAFFALSWLTSLTDPNQKKLATFWILAITGMVGARVLARAVARRLPAYAQNTIIVGAGTVGQLIGRKLFQHPEYGMRLLGFVDADPKEQRRDLRSLSILGELEDLPRLVAELNVDRVILSFSNDGHPEALETIRLLRDLSVQVDVVPRLYEAIGERVVFHSVEGLPLLGLPPMGISRASRLIKRTIDTVGASIALIVFAPTFLVISLAILIESGRPVFFRQPRLTRNMNEFTMLKFRTMRVDTDDAPHRAYIGQLMTSEMAPEGDSLYKLARGKEVTRIGALLRRTSLDELPQFINVLLGDMSLVGPRPCIEYETAYFKPHHFERFRVPAGMTGLWQVTGRAHTTFADALDLDVAYTRSWSLGLDLRLLARTPFLVLRGAKETA
jgi:exopolysaccharide biosynthesis polyprenyl glycosylphosphotransferase